MAGKFRNFILAALPQKEVTTIKPLLTPVALEQGHVLTSPDVETSHVWFVEGGIASVTYRLGSKFNIEIGMVGREGFLGASNLADVRKVQLMSQIVVSGQAFRLDRSDFAIILQHCPTLRKLARKYLDFAFVQAASAAVANARGSVEQRVARWLLMCHDRSDHEHLPVTHDTLAVLMGVRRPSITNAMHTLEGKMLIRSTRGDATIIDRLGLEKVAADFYGGPEKEYERLGVISNHLGYSEMRVDKTLRSPAIAPRHLEPPC